MTSHEMLQADLLDIVFDNRNKAYGAYALRKEYHQRLGIAVGSGIGCALLLLLLCKPSAAVVAAFDTPAPPETVVVRTYELPKEPPLPPAPAPTPAVRSVHQEHFTNRVAIVPDDAVQETDLVPPVSDLPAAAFGVTREEGLPAGGATEAAPVSGVAAAQQTLAAPEVYEATAVDEPALFPGGEAAFRRYLALRLDQPQGLAPGEMRTARVRFVVSKDGTVLAVEVIQSAEAGLDATVVRALERMPRWKPAQKAGRQVAVVFTLPVTFVGPEE